MNKTTEALKMAIEALSKDGWIDTDEIINACKEALESQDTVLDTRSYLLGIADARAKIQEQEPEGWMKKYNFRFAPQPLSDGALGKILDELDIGAAMTDWMLEFARAIEQAHGIGVKDGTRN